MGRFPIGQKVTAVTKILFLFPKRNVSKNQNVRHVGPKNNVQVPHYIEYPWKENEVTTGISRFQKLSRLRPHGEEFEAVRTFGELGVNFSWFCADVFLDGPFFTSLVVAFSIARL